jgi:hypothetical protein
MGWRGNDGAAFETPASPAPQAEVFYGMASRKTNAPHAEEAASAAVLKHAQDWQFFPY